MQGSIQYYAAWFLEDFIPQICRIRRLSPISVDLLKVSALCLQKSDDNPPHNSEFECNICFDVAKNAVISLCGHLFCWSCLHQWLETLTPEGQKKQIHLCPVCKAVVDREKVIPLYGRSGHAKDPRDSVPPRPQGQRTEPNILPRINMTGLGDTGYQFSLGIGAFPLSIFASYINFGENRPPAPPAGTYQYEAEQTLNRLFGTLVVAVILWLILS
uniref:RING-type E3 ubiquitin transferase n=1 Tax=Romanomermis culicivorax TaxID=13658 RepID=A0A915J705_ROMCU